MMGIIILSLINVIKCCQLHVHILQCLDATMIYTLLFATRYLPNHIECWPCVGMIPSLCISCSMPLLGINCYTVHVLQPELLVNLNSWKSKNLDQAHAQAATF
uniref:Uncharacterized protein n=1 Tax=Cryptomonas curvata TaxID=233186 RepID=A0A7S0QG49_9CRYP|mmetsp:Transcript_25678/g.53375  ORF Transcript_25678/g.53375 Transcript_25678/m.53375 type:complete len:103 (+) Transcript_25678:190-498(+)